MNEQKSTPISRRVFVDLWALETLQRRRRLVVAIPAECETDDLRELSGVALDQWAEAAGADADWEHEDAEGFEVEETIHVEDGVPEHLAPDLVLVRDEDGRLVLRDED